MASGHDLENLEDETSPGGSLGHFAGRGQSLYAPPVNFRSGLDQGAWLLHGLVRSMRPAVCVEIGSARGCSACYIGLRLRHMGHGKLFAIDPHAATDWNDSKSVDTYDVMRENLRAFGVEDYVEIVQRYSPAAAEEWRRRSTCSSSTATTCMRASAATGNCSCPTCASSGSSCSTTRHGASVRSRGRTPRKCPRPAGNWACRGSSRN